jgi:hypothetical protein
VKYSTALTDAGRRLLRNLEHSSRQLKGTMEVRKITRFKTHAGRIRRGVPIFVTWSPDEKHNVLMIRMHRARANDPIHTMDQVEEIRTKAPTSMDQDSVTMAIPAEDVEKWLPNYDDRRAILARDGLASVDGFRTGILLVCELLWGLRICPMCPDCNHGDANHGCQDFFGSNAFAEGCIVGRGDGVYISFEAQKSPGSVHGHSRFHVQCVHQNIPLSEVMAAIAGGKARIVEEIQRARLYTGLRKRVCLAAGKSHGAGRGLA